MLVFGLTWQVVSWLKLANERIISSPAGVLKALYVFVFGGDLLDNIWISAQEFLIGMFFALVIGVVLGLLMGWYKRIGLLLDPIVMTFYTLPRDALLPVIIVWLGIGLASKAAVVFLGAVFPLIVNMGTGIRETDPMMIKAARSFGASQSEIFRKILLPSCLPYLMAGVRLGIGRGVTGVIIAEMYVSTKGIGALIMKAQIGLATDNLFALVLFTATLGYVLITLARKVENHVGRWRQEAIQ